ncbi:hypothetical protein D5F01_LYC12214 [Larimichthys crocea]|uniref:Uncharacterized protein n=1 Tax=Larimichthys crocea TaxID=215358 RepID=A0A6G0IAX1_LARCR|nr:hypothetical protein D5F01_LYC12214 [Larimichthys crocea]
MNEPSSSHVTNPTHSRPLYSKVVTGEHKVYKQQSAVEMTDVPTIARNVCKTTASFETRSQMTEPSPSHVTITKTTHSRPLYSKVVKDSTQDRKPTTTRKHPTTYLQKHRSPPLRTSTCYSDTHPGRHQYINTSTTTTTTSKTTPIPTKPPPPSKTRQRLGNSLSPIPELSNEDEFPPLPAPHRSTVLSLGPRTTLAEHIRNYNGQHQTKSPPPRLFQYNHQHLVQLHSPHKHTHIPSIALTNHKKPPDLRLEPDPLFPDFNLPPYHNSPH